MFAAVGNFELHPDGDEVSEGRWWEADEIDKAIGTNVLTPNFEYEFKMIRQSLFSLL